MPRRSLMSMVIVVPSFAENDQRHEKIVYGSVCAGGLVRTRSNFVTNGIDETKRVQHCDSIEQADPNEEAHRVVSVERRRLKPADESAREKRDDQDSEIGEIVPSLIIE